MRVHVPMRGECPDHLMDLNFSFNHNFLIRRLRGALRRYRVRTGPGKPGKSWNFVMTFSRTGKSWKKATGPGKFLKFVKLG